MATALKTTLGLLLLAPSLLVADAAKDQVGFTPSGGIFTNATLSVQLSAPKTGAQIRYTLDGSEPDSDSPLYSAPIALTNTALVRAKLFATGSNQSTLVSQSYLLVEPELAGFNSNLPLII